MTTPTTPPSAPVDKVYAPLSREAFSVWCKAQPDGYNAWDAWQEAVDRASRADATHTLREARAAGTETANHTHSDYSDGFDAGKEQALATVAANRSAMSRWGNELRITYATQSEADKAMTALSVPIVASPAAPASGVLSDEHRARLNGGLVDALRRQRQIDEDGTEVGVCREAVDVAADILSNLISTPPSPAQPTAPQAGADEEGWLYWTDNMGVEHHATLSGAIDILKSLFDEWPGGLEEIAAAMKLRGTAPQAADTVEAGAVPGNDELRAEEAALVKMAYEYGQYGTVSREKLIAHLRSYAALFTASQPEFSRAASGAAPVAGAGSDAVMGFLDGVDAERVGYEFVKRHITDRTGLQRIEWYSFQDKAPGADNKAVVLWEGGMKPLALAIVLRDDMNRSKLVTWAAPAAPSGVPGDAEMLDWLEKNAGRHVISLGQSWYVRNGYGEPHQRRATLREAIRAAMAKTEGGV